MIIASRSVNFVHGFMYFSWSVESLSICDEKHVVHLFLCDLQGRQILLYENTRSQEPFEHL